MQQAADPFGAGTDIGERKVASDQRPPAVGTKLDGGSLQGHAPLALSTGTSTAVYQGVSYLLPHLMGGLGVVVSAVEEGAEGVAYDKTASW